MGKKRKSSESDIVRKRLQRSQEGNELPPHLEDIADLIGSVDDDLPADFSARKKHYLRLWGYGHRLGARTEIC